MIKRFIRRVLGLGSAAPLRVENPEEWFKAREAAIKAVIGEEGEVVVNHDKALDLPGIF